MAKERVINTRFWNDGFVSMLDPTEKLLFIYFITNEHTNISGIYELPLKIIAIETGLDPSMLEKILPRLGPKVSYDSGWVIMPNFPKHQHTDSENVQKGIKRELSLVPDHILETAKGLGYPLEGYVYPIGGVSYTKPILNLTKPTDGEVETSLSFEDWLEENSYEEVEMYLGEEEGEGKGYKHSSRKKPFTIQEVEKLYKASQKPVVGSKRPVRDEYHYDFDAWIERLKNSHQKTDKIVAFVWQRKGYRFDNYEQWKARFDQDKKYASQLKGYSPEDVDRVVRVCEKEGREQGYDWSISTLVKKIANVISV